MKHLTLLLLLTLAACGKLGPLAPVTPDRAPPRPNYATVPPTPDEQLKLQPQAEPDRIDDPLKKSEERKGDRFDLPPPGRG